MRERVVQVGDVALAIAEAGEGGRPILLLHGFAGAKEDFTDWLDRLADSGFHAVAPDHRGHGDSSKPIDHGAYSMSILAGDALALADTLGWDRFALLGHSMGGFVAQLIALRAPGRLSALILMDTGHGPIEAIDPDQAQMAISIVQESGIDVLADLLESRESPLDTPAHRRLVAERPGYLEFNERKLRASAAPMYAAILPELMTCADTLHQLEHLAPTPSTLVVVGEQDTPFLESSKRIGAAIPRATVAVITDAGHSPQFENSDEWWRSVSTFLAGTD